MSWAYDWLTQMGRLAMLSVNSLSLSLSLSLSGQGQVLVGMWYKYGTSLFHQNGDKGKGWDINPHSKVQTHACACTHIHFASWTQVISCITFFNITPLNNFSLIIIIIIIITNSLLHNLPVPLMLTKYQDNRRSISISSITFLNYVFFELYM